MLFRRFCWSLRGHDLALPFSFTINTTENGTLERARLQVTKVIRSRHSVPLSPREDSLYWRRIRSVSKIAATRKKELSQTATQIGFSIFTKCPTDWSKAIRLCVRFSMTPALASRFL